MLGAGLILEYRATGQLAGSFMTMLVINLIFTFGFSSFISVGGHIGGLIGGLLGTAVIVYRGRFREGFEPATVAGLVAVGALSIAIAYWKVHGMV
jgi:hypothetical protein